MRCRRLEDQQMFAGSAVIYISLVVKISTVLSLLSQQIYVIVHTSIANTYFVFLFDSCKGCLYLLAVACTN